MIETKIGEGHNLGISLEFSFTFDLQYLSFVLFNLTLVGLMSVRLKPKII